MAQLKDIFKVTQSQYDTLVNGGTVGSHTYDSNAIYLVEGSGAQNITYNFAKGYDGFTVTPSEGTPQTVPVTSTRIYRLDTRNTNPNPYAADNYAGCTTVHLKDNSAIGITGEGSFSALMQIYPWSDATGGSVHQLAYGTNGGIYHRYGTSTWSTWNRLATREWVNEQLGSGGGFDLSNYATLTGDQTFNGKNIFTATNNYNTIDTQKFLVGNSSSAFCIGGDGLQCFSGTNSTTAKVMYINYYGGNVEIGKTGGTQIINLYGTVKENGTALSSTYLGINAKAADSDKLDGQDSSYYMKASDISNHISGTDQPNLAYFATSSKVAHIANTSADNVGNIKAVSYGIYTDVANNKAATWQYNSSTDCVELVW